MSTKAELVRYELSDGVAELTLNRPERLNAVIPQLVTQLVAALRRAIEDGPAVALLRGAGRSFCSGFDLRHDRGQRTEQEHRRQIEAVQDVTRLIRRADFPVISAVQGFALGNGCEFALAADLVVAERTATFGFPEVEWGLSVTGGVSQLLVQAVGLHRAKQLLFLGGRFDAEQAHEWGLVNRLAEPGTVDSCARQVARELCSRPRAALGRAKRALDLVGAGPLNAAFTIEIEHALLAGTSDETARSITEFGRSRGGAR